MIIDEADKLVDGKMIEFVRDIHETTQAPVVLIGEELLPKKLEAHERVHNRVLDFRLAQPCDLEDAATLADFLIPDLTIAEDLLDDIRKQTAGKARRIATTLHEIGQFARNHGLKDLDRASYTGRIFTGETPSGGAEGGADGGGPQAQNDQGSARAARIRARVVGHSRSYARRRTLHETRRRSGVLRSGRWVHARLSAAAPRRGIVEEFGLNGSTADIGASVSACWIAAPKRRACAGTDRRRRPRSSNCCGTRCATFCATGSHPANLQPSRLPTTV
ncbi:MAG: hypothetical protein HPM95_13230 [Alphaproteobacteria bacterium]|nr:hypothetical protein [Alphaproteobacteria bacterium]